MKKRLRKKKHRGEFVEWGAPIAIARNRQDDFDSFLDNFIEQAIEGNACYFGGGGQADRLEGVIELGKTSDGPEARLKKVVEWLETRQDVEKYVTGKIVDLWHGSFDEIDTIGDSISSVDGAGSRGSRVLGGAEAAYLPEQEVHSPQSETHSTS